MSKKVRAPEYGAPLMSAFREAAAARDARKRMVQTVAGERIVPGRHSSQRKGDESVLEARSVRGSGRAAQHDRARRFGGP